MTQNENLEFVPNSRILVRANCI